MPVMATNIKVHLVTGVVLFLAYVAVIAVGAARAGGQPLPRLTPARRCRAAPAPTRAYPDRDGGQ